MKKEIRVYEGWKDISLGKMKGLEKIGEENKGLNEFELSCLYISYLYECEAKDLNFKEFQAYAQSLTFLGEPIPETKLKLEYNINGKEYSLDINPASFTAGQYYDFSQYNLKEKKDLIDFLSVILIPKGHTYCDDYNIEDVKEELLSLPMPDVNAISEEEDDEGRIRRPEEGNQNPLSNFTILPFILTYCKLTNERFSDVLKESVIQVFTVASYEIIRMKAEEEQLKKYKKTH